MSDTIQFGNLKIEITRKDNEVIYRFEGDVDESFRQKDVPRIKATHITFVLEKINNFNSCGIREWIYLLRDMNAMGKIKFTQCSITMIDQINMVPDSLGTGFIESFYAPYFCDEHGEVNRLIETKGSAADLKKRQAPPMNCDICKKTLEFDALEESYFLFTSEDMNKAS